MRGCPLMTVCAKESQQIMQISWVYTVMRNLPKTKPAKSRYIAMICCDLVAQTVIRGHAHTSLHIFFFETPSQHIFIFGFPSAPLRISNGMARIIIARSARGNAYQIHDTLFRNGGCLIVSSIYFCPSQPISLTFRVTLKVIVNSLYLQD